MKHNLFLAAIILFLASCDNNKKQESSEQKNKQEQKKDDEVAHIMIPESGCYAHYSSGDTILLKIEVFPNVVTGVLKYQLSGKDKNEGTIEGKWMAINFSQITPSLLRARHPSEKLHFY